MPDNKLASDKPTGPAEEQQEQPAKVRLQAWVDREAFAEIVAGYRAAGLTATPAECLRMVSLGFARIPGMQAAFREGLALVMLEEGSSEGVA
jgi:hypothetical protein